MCCLVILLCPVALWWCLLLLIVGCSGTISVPEPGNTSQPRRIHQSVRPSVHPSVCPSICPSVRLSISFHLSRLKAVHRSLLQPLLLYMRFVSAQVLAATHVGSCVVCKLAGAGSRRAVLHVVWECAGTSSRDSSSWGHCDSPGSGASTAWQKATYHHKGIQPNLPQLLPQ